MGPPWTDPQAMLQFQQTLFLLLIWLLAVSACVMTFVCLLFLWWECYRSPQHRNPPLQNRGCCQSPLALSKVGTLTLLSHQEWERDHQPE